MRKLEGGPLMTIVVKIPEDVVFSLDEEARALSKKSRKVINRSETVRRILGEKLGKALENSKKIP